MKPSEQEIVPALLRRVRRALAEAERAVERSRTLTRARSLVEPDAHVSRCAWCGRAALGTRWLTPDELPAFVSRRALDGASHGICPDCVDELERDGRSHPHRPERRLPPPPSA